MPTTTLPTPPFAKPPCRDKGRWREIDDLRKTGTSTKSPLTPLYERGG